MKHILIIIIIISACLGCIRAKRGFEAVLKEVRDTNFPFAWVKFMDVPIVAKPGIPRLITFVYELSNLSETPLSIEPNFTAILGRKSTHPKVMMEGGLHPVLPSESAKILLTLDEECIKELRLDWEVFQTEDLMKDINFEYTPDNASGDDGQHGFADVIFFKEDSVVYLVGNHNVWI